jgi:hypothetical protein
VTLHVHLQALGASVVWAAIAACTAYVTRSTAQSTKGNQPEAGAEVSPIYGVRSPAGYRDWQLISVSHLTGGSLSDPPNVQFMVKDSKRYASTGVGDLLTSKTADLAMKPSTQHASPAISLLRTGVSSSITRRPRRELNTRGFL